MKLCAILISILITLAPQLASAEFIRIKEFEDRTIFIETADIIHLGNLVVFWSLIDHADTQIEISDKYLSSKGQWEFDCAQKKSRQLFHAIYSGKMGGGKTIWSGSLDQKSQPIVPGSIGEDLYKHVCK